MLQSVLHSLSYSYECITQYITQWLLPNDIILMDVLPNDITNHNPFTSVYFITYLANINTLHYYYILNLMLIIDF